MFFLCNRSIGSWNGTPLSEKPYTCVAQSKGHCTIFFFDHAHLSFLDFQDDRLMGKTLHCKKHTKKVFLVKQSQVDKGGGGGSGG